MKIKAFSIFAKVTFALAFFLSGTAYAQWSGTYGNGWIDYSKPHIRIGIKTKGLHKIPFTILPNDFKTAAAGNYQLFHRGVEVRIKVDGDGIIFYGEPNDGDSDKWLFRPGPEARVNPYVSFFSDEGSYILTYAVGAKRMTPAIDGTATSGDPEPYHFQKFIRTYNDQFNYSTLILTSSEILNNSFYQEQNSYISSYLVGASQMDETLTLTNWATTASELPTLEVMVHGNGDVTHNFDFSVGKTNGDGDHTTALTSLSFSKSTPGNPPVYARKTPVFSIPAANLNATGGILRTKSKSAGDYTAQTYYILTYPQTSTITGQTSLFMNYKSSADASPAPIHVGVTGADASLVLYNITDPHNVREIAGTLTSGTYHASVSRAQNEEIRLLAALPSAISPVTADMISTAEIQPRSLYVNENNVRDANASTAIDPASYDYLIVTSEPFSTKYNATTGAVETLGKADEYAKYRSSNAGGAYKVAVFEIKSIYNQFNYGEPSPVAIKRFVDYMVSKGIRYKHNLLLIGNSVTAPDGPSVVRLKKEMPLEVPSIGDPASDFLLVAGVHGLGEDIPAIPVGRIPTNAAPSGTGVVNPDEILYYLSKVKKYEAATGNLDWRKNIIHIDGSKQGEGFGAAYLDPLIPIAKALDVTRSVETVGRNPVNNDVRPANITDQVNSGTGMLTYYGHGGYNFTQTNIGMFTQASLVYADAGKTYTANSTVDKFPLIYFNGCGVGNAFTSRNRVSTCLAADWVLAENVGAIAVIGSSFNSFAAPTAIYLKLLYKELFEKTDLQRETIGHIKDIVAKNIMAGNFTARTTAVAGEYDKNNLHIANLFGDPALRLLATTKLDPLPVEFSFVGAVAKEKEHVVVTWKTAWEKGNSRFVVQRSSNGVNNFTDIGVVDAKGNISEQSAYTFLDMNPVLGINYYRIGQIDLGETDPQKFSRTVSVDWRSDEIVVVSPNPASSFVDITLDGLYQLKTWKLYDLQGKKIKQGVSRKVSLDGLTPGDYIIEMEMSNNEIRSRKVVKY